jgi:exonuclease III
MINNILNQQPTQNRQFQYNHENFNVKNLSGLSFLIQNVDSMNLSTFKNDGTIRTFQRKMNAILNIKADIIMLCDTRCKNKSNIIENYVQCTEFGNYKIITNSQLSKRGVALLYKDSLDFTITDFYKSDCQNILLVNGVLNGLDVCLGSIYGPTDANDPDFFDNLRAKLVSFAANRTFIIGGDNNALTSTLAPSLNPHDSLDNTKRYDNNNPDILNMHNIPNPRHSQQIVDGIADEFWFDPFRFQNKNKRDYSFIPRGGLKMNRSRIDFFLISKNLLGCVNKTEYLPKLTNDFDHKGVLLTLKVTDKTKKFNIDSNFLNFAGVKEIASREALMLYADVDRRLQPIFDEYTQVCHDLCQVTLFLTEKCDKTKNRLVYNFQQYLVEKAKSIISLYIDDWDHLANSPTIIDKSLFFETLQNNIKINLVEYQKLLKFAETKFLNEQKKRLEQLKSDPLSLCLDVFDLEKIIEEINDKKNSQLCQKSLAWRVLNLEKPTRGFCSIAKSKKSSDSLSKVCNKIRPNVFSPFNNSKDRSDYIAEFYTNIYKKGNAVDHNISSFLGEDICNSNYVQDKKLSELERDNMEKPLDVAELDHAIKRANKFSANGADGWSYSAIEYFWSIFRSPLANSFNHMVEQGSLQHSFKLVNVKLIPKKDNPQDIGNWRPISLLSCMYKLTSSAITGRIKNVYDKIVSERQKAYSKNKCIQEAVINILDSINKGIKANSNMNLICIDFRKAFDTLSHSFIIESLKFFGFGDHMLNIIKTILTGRVGAILTEDGLSKIFEFLSGSGQGDSISAFLFCIALEILLIKLKLSPTISRISIPNPDIEGGSELLEMSGFADDVTDIIEATHENLINYKTILNDFFRISDLAINASKTSCIPISQAINDEFFQAIENEGFKRETSFKVLGFIIDNKLENLRINVINTIEKIKKIINFWDKFTISTIGRVNIYKTYILSQIAYSFSILNVDISDYNLIDKLSFNFVTKGLRISKNKSFLPSEMGGLGLIYSRQYILALRIGLFKRHLNSNDSWSMAITLSQKNIIDRFNIDFGSRVLNLNPHAKLISDAFKFFYHEYNRMGGNFLKAPLFNNFGLFRDLNNDPLKIDIFELQTRTLYPVALENLRLFDVLTLNPPNIKHKEIIERNLSVNLTENDYLALSNIIRPILDRRNADLNKSCISLKVFLIRSKKVPNSIEIYFSVETFIPKRIRIC